MQKIDGSGHTRLVDSVLVFQRYLVKEVGRVKQDFLILVDSMNEESNEFFPDYLKMEIISKKIEYETLQRIESLLSAELGFIKETLNDQMPQQTDEE